MRKYKQKFLAGAFINPVDAGTNSLGAIDVSSNATFRGTNNYTGNQTFAGLNSLAALQVNSIEGGSGWRGIATVASGTVVASVSATAARSGAVILLTKYMGADQAGSGSNLRNFMVESVRAGAFEIRACDSVFPTAAQPIAWAIIR